MGVTVDNTTVAEVIDVVLEMEKMIAQLKNQVSITCSIKELVDKKYNNETRHSQAMLKIHLLAAKNACEEMQRSMKKSRTQTAPQQKINTFFMKK